jgi:hypothetical protein
MVRFIRIIAATVLTTAAIVSAQMTPDEAEQRLKERQAIAATQPDVFDLQSANQALREKNEQLQKQLADAMATITKLKAQLAKMPDAGSADSSQGLFVGMAEADMLAYANAHKWSFQMLSESTAGKIYERAGGGGPSGVDGMPNGAPTVLLTVTVLDGKIVQIDGMASMRQ